MCRTEIHLHSVSCEHYIAITEGPVSVVGTNAQFHCAGTGNYLLWEVDEVQADHRDILARGITVVMLPSSGTVQSNLTVPATSENNGTQYCMMCHWCITVQFNSNQ